MLVTRLDLLATRATRHGSACGDLPDEDGDRATNFFTATFYLHNIVNGLELTSLMRAVARSGQREAICSTMTATAMGPASGEPMLRSPLYAGAAAPGLQGAGRLGGRTRGHGGGVEDALGRFALRNELRHLVSHRDERVEELAAVAEFVYSDDPERLVVLDAAVAALEAAGSRVLVKEVEGTTERYPHAYGTIRVDAVVRVRPAGFDAGGRFTILC